MRPNWLVTAMRCFTAAALLGAIAAAGACGGDGTPTTPAAGAEEAAAKQMSEADLAAFESSARSAVASLRAGLSAEMKKALDEGAQQAIAVCRIKAPEIAAEQSTGELLVGRTSHRVRNPDNAATPWMKIALDEYLDAGPDAAPRAFVLESGEMAYVEPIYALPQCSVCHGEKLSPVIADILHDLYPDDDAVGFKTGDLRGLYWAVSRGGEDLPG